VRRMGEESDPDISLRDLQGNTLIVYWFLLRSDKTYSAREIQRKTGISSSSLALHHLNKLIDLGLVKKDNYGEYSVARKVNPGLLSLFSGKGRSFMPRFVFYAAFSIGLLLSSIYLFYYRLSTASVILIISNAVFSLIFCVESIRLWRNQPV
jgi:hypothetical protein